MQNFMRSDRNFTKFRQIYELLFCVVNMFLLLFTCYDFICKMREGGLALHSSEGFFLLYFKLALKLYRKFQIGL